MLLPFMFLEFQGHTSDEIRENLVMVACQLIMKRVPHGGAEVSSRHDNKDVLWVVWVQTDFEIFKIYPHITSALFRGWGGVKDGGRILSPFRTNFLVNPAEIGIDLMKICLSNPDGFLEMIKESFSWEQYLLKILL